MSSSVEYRSVAGGVAEPFEAREGVLELPAGLALHHGARLPEVRIAWRLAGARGAPVVAALGGISAHRRVFDSGEGALPGWWDEIAGSGLPLDSERFRILGIDFLGGSGDTTGPRAGQAFPTVSTYDQAAALLAVVNHLNVATLRAIAGASYGGMVALAFAERYPERVERLLVVSAADRTHPLATAWRSVQRRTVRFALRQGDGAAGLELARALAMATYRSGAEFAQRFRAPPRFDPGGHATFAVEDYLFARGAQYASRYLPESFLCLSESIDLHQVDAGRIRTPAWIVGVREDQLVPLDDVRALTAHLGPRAHLHEISSLYGHDAFLKERAQLDPIFTAALASHRHD